MPIATNNIGMKKSTGTNQNRTMFDSAVFKIGVQCQKKAEYPF